MLLSFPWVIPIPQFSLDSHKLCFICFSSLPLLPAPRWSSEAVQDSGTSRIRSLSMGWFSWLAGERPNELSRPRGQRGPIRGTVGERTRNFLRGEGMGVYLLFMSFFNTTILLWPCPFIQTTCTKTRLQVRQRKRRNTATYCACLKILFRNRINTNILLYFSF